MRRLHVLSVASEIFPLVKTGGLADVVGALPPALAREGIAMRTLIPGYPAVREALARRRGRPHVCAVCTAGRRGFSPRARRDSISSCSMRRTSTRGRAIRTSVPTGTTGPTTGFASPRSPRAAAAIARGAVAGYAPDIVHAHDWQAGLVPALLHYGGAPRPGTVMTVHNLSFQGQFPARPPGERSDLPPHAYTIDGVEYHGTIGYLKAGLALADRITTVSPTYAAEIRTPEDGMGLDGLLRKRAGVLTGILNGIDDNVWNPATDALPRRALRRAAPFAPRARTRRACRRASGSITIPRPSCSASSAG